MDTIIKNLETICTEAEKSAKASNWDAIGQFFTDSAQKWESLAPDGAHPELRKRFDDARTEFNTRLEHDVLRRARIAEREALCAELEKYASSDNIAEFADRMKEIENTWKNLPPLQQQYLEILQARFVKAAHAFSSGIEIQREEQSLKNERMPEIERLCMKAEDLADTTEWAPAEKEIKEVRRKWLRAVAGIKGLEQFHARFDKALADFERRRDELAALLAAETKLLTELCAEMETCLKAENPKSMINKVKELKERWKLSEIRDPVKEELQKNFRIMLNSYHRKINEIFEEEDWSRWENYTMKLGLCEKADKLSLEPSFNLRFKLLKGLQDEWKRIGAVPREKSEELWDRFHKSCEGTYLACREFFDEQGRKRAENLAKKISFCEQAEAIQASEEWEKTAEKLKAMQAEWFTTGQVTKGKEEETFQRFRKACNAFFERRKAHYDELHKVRAENRKIKVSLCEEAEALLGVADPMQSINTAMELRKKWKNAPHAGWKDEHALWERFDSALNKFFEKIDQFRGGNLQRKQEISAEIERLANSPELATDCEKVADQARKLDDEWCKIGPSPRDKGRDVEEKYSSVLRLFEGKYREAQRSLQKTFELNVNAKEAVLVEIAGFASGAPEADKIGEAASAFEAKWNSVGPVVKEKAAGLDARFAEMLTALKNNDKDYFNAVSKKQKENLKTKKELCVKLEQLAGAPSSDEVKPDTGVSVDLIKELQLAIESNFGKAADGRLENPREAQDRFDKIRKQWDKTGPVPAEDREKLEKRFQEACNSFNKKYRRR